MDHFKGILQHSRAVRLADRLAADALVERWPERDGREVALYLTDADVAARERLLAFRNTALSEFLDVLSPGDTKRPGELLHKLLARRDTFELDRFTICRICDNGICVDCPLPTRHSQRV